MEVDDFIVIIGELGKYQQVWLFLLSLVGIAAALTNLNIVVLMAVPDHWCFVPGLDGLNLSPSEKKLYSIPKEEKNGELGYSSCVMYERNYSVTEKHVRESIAGMVNGSSAVASNLSTMTCQHGLTYDKSVYTSSLVTQFDLVCDQTWLQAVGKSVFFAGLMVGVLLFATTSDMFGRRKSLLASMVMLAVMNIAQAFAPHVAAFMVFRFLGAMANVGSFTTAFVTMLEIVGPSFRVDAGLGIQYMFTVGYMMTAGIAYLIRDHFYFQLAVSIPLISYVYLYWIAPETARWFYANDRKDEGEAMLRKMAKWNKAGLPEKIDVTVQKEERKANITDLFRTPRLRYRTINLCFNWMVNTMVYYGLSLNSTSLAGDPYLNFFLAGAVEFPAYVLCHVTLKRFGRRWPHSLTMVAGGIALLGTLAVPSDLAWMTTVLTMIGKFCITASFGIVYLFSAEVFPTVVRQVGVSTGSCFARIGAITSPYVSLLSDVNVIIPPIIFGVLSITAGLLVLLLPETKGRTLPQSIEEGEVFGTKHARYQGTEAAGKERLNPMYLPEIPNSDVPLTKF